MKVSEHRQFRRAWTLGIACLIAALGLESASSALELGHVRARTRGFENWYRADADGGDQVEGDGVDFDSSAGAEDDFGLEAESGLVAEEEAFEDAVALEEVEEKSVVLDGAAEETNIIGNRGSSEKAGWVERGRNVVSSMRFWNEKDPNALRPFKRVGYLAMGPPNAFRFSDDAMLASRPPMPALPEFTVLPQEYVPYVIEEMLPEDARNDPSILSEVVIEMEPHTIMSGNIDTRIYEKEEKVEEFSMEEPRSSVLKPEEVLIFFETDGVQRDAKAVIPFSPAQPSTQTIESSARYKKE